MFENPFNKMFAPADESSKDGLPKLTEEQREAALDHVEELKHGGQIKLTPEEEAVLEEKKNREGQQAA